MAAKAQKGQVSADQLIAAFEQYKGKVPYVYGGSTPKGWDCSGMPFYVLPHDLGIEPPGRVVMSYVTSSRLVTVKNPLPGDFVLWPGLGPVGHMGIYLGPNKMLSALSPHYGTAETPIKGFGPTPVFIYRRFKSLQETGGTTTTSSPVDSVTGALGGAVLNQVMSSLGIQDVGDLLERAGLILFGALLLIIGLWKFSSSGQSAGGVVKQTVENQKQAHGEEKKAVREAAEE